MAEQHHIPKTKGRGPQRKPLEVDDGPACVRYEGTREQLRDGAGIPAAWLDRVSFEKGQPHTAEFFEGEKCIRLRATSKHRVLVYVSYPPREAEERLEAHRKARDAEREAERTINAWPKTAEALRAELATLSLMHSRITSLMCAYLTGDERVGPGCSGDPETLEAIQLHAQGVRNAIESAVLRVDPRRIGPAAAAVRREAFGSDKGFERFMAGLAEIR